MLYNPDEPIIEGVPTIQAHTFILASSSPQRKLLLEQIGLEFQILPADFEEDQNLGSSAAELVGMLAMGKLVARLKEPHPEVLPQSFIMTADTIVSLDEKRLGKPKDRRQAEDFLIMLSGRTHEVLTAVCLYIPRGAIVDSSAIQVHSPLPTPSLALPEGFSSEGIMVSAMARTQVSLMKLSEEEIQCYLDRGEYEGAAGAYRIQGRAGCFLQNIHGSYSNVMGLPINVLYGILRKTTFWSR